MSFIIMLSKDIFIPVIMCGISFAESNFGKYNEHQEIKNGMHRGHSAIGHLGIMPIVAAEVAKKYKLIEGDVDLEKTRKLMLTSEAFYNSVAKIMLMELSEEFNYSLEDVAYAWYAGKAAAKKATKAQKISHFYVKRVQTGVITYCISAHKKKISQANNRSFTRRELNEDWLDN